MPILDASNTELQGQFTGTAKQKGANMPTVQITDGTLSGKFTGSITYDETTTPPPITEPPPTTDTGPTGGLITSFDPAKYHTSVIDGLEYSAHTYGGDWSKKKIDDHTIRYEIRQADVGWTGTNNSMMEAFLHHRDNTAMKIAYRIMVEPGAANGADWMTTVEWHNDDTDWPAGTSPPAVIEIKGEKWRVGYKYCPPGGDPTNGPNSNQVTVYPWTSPGDIVRGQWYVFEIDLKFNQTSGWFKVKLDGQQIVNYSGPMGYGCDTYLMFGLYRAQRPETFADQIRNMTVSWATV